MYDSLLLLGCPEGTCDADGAISIRGELPVYHPPRGNGAYPIVEPGDQVRVYCNDQLVTSPTVVLPGDLLRFEVDEVPPDVVIQVELSPDEMTARLTIRRRAGIRYRIVDAPPAHILRPRAEVATTLPPRPVSLDEVVAAIEGAGVCHGVDMSAVRLAVDAANREDAPEQLTFVVAVGDPPRPPRDSRLQLAPGLDRDALVEPGQILARKIPATAGRPGRSVRGRVIPVPEPRDPPLRVGKGAELAPDGSTVVASRGGRLVVHGWTVWVQSVHQVPGDVTAAESPVRFPGDIVVLGQLCPGSEVRAAGKVRVSGCVDSATVQASGGIESQGGVFRATLIAGMDAASDTATLLATLKVIAHELSRLYELIRAAARQMHRSEAEVASRVLELRGGELRKALQRLQNDPSKERLPGGLAELLAGQLTGLGAARLQGSEALQPLMAHVNAAIDQLQGELEAEAWVRVPYVHNSVVKASGGVVLTGRGSYHSQIHAAASVEAPQGTLVGGEIVVARGHVSCHRLGGERSVTQVAVGEGGYVRARIVVPDVVVQIGGHRLTVTHPERLVTFVVKDDRIVREPWKPDRAAP